MIDHPPILVEALCTHELFKQFGYDTREMYFIVAKHREGKEGFHDIHVELHHRGKEVGVRIGETNVPTDDLMARWKDAIVAWDATDAATAQSIFLSSACRKDAVNIIAALLFHGLGSTPEQIEQYDAAARAKGEA